MKSRVIAPGRRAAALIILILIAALIFAYFLSADDRETRDYSAIYNNLIDTAVPGDSSEEIYDDFSKMKNRSEKPSQQEIANIVAAESMHYEAEGGARSREVARQGVRYLLDLRTDYPNGYGCFFEWDAWSDGSVNPENTSYAITNAAVLDAFTEAVNAGVLNEKDKERTEDAIHDIITDYCENYFTPVNKQEGYFWYSDQDADDVDCPNVSSSFAGAAAKAMKKCPGVFNSEEKALVRKRVSMVQKRLSTQAGREDGALFWYYSEGSRSPNDLIHMCFILEGILDIREYGAGYSWEWSGQDEKNSIDMYYYGGSLHKYMRSQKNHDEADLYGFGGIIEYYSKTGDNEKAERYSDAALDSFEGLESGKYKDLRQETFFIKGLAEYLYGK